MAGSLEEVELLIEADIVGFRAGEMVERLGDFLDVVLDERLGAEFCFPVKSR